MKQQFINQIERIETLASANAYRCAFDAEVDKLV